MTTIEKIRRFVQVSRGDVVGDDQFTLTPESMGEFVDAFDLLDYLDQLEDDDSIDDDVIDIADVGEEFD